MRPHLHNVNLHIAVIYTYTILIAAEYFPTEQRKSDNKYLLHVDKGYDKVLEYGKTKSVLSNIG